MSHSKKKERRSLHGVVLLDKPTGMSSNHALQKVKHALGAKKAGHTGSLDPLASGLLPICLGQATKVCEYLLGSSKRYRTVIKLGQTTDTLDAEGQVLETREVLVTEADLQAALPQFRGQIEQVPPMYSALKKDGQPLYKLARKGEEIDRPARQMTVYDLQAELIDSHHVAIDVHCSSGFYVRSLAHDLGRVLGCGAHVVELRRTEIKNLNVNQAISLQDLLESEKADHLIQPIDVLLDDFPVLQLDEDQLEELRHGRKPLAKGLVCERLARFYTPEKALLAVGEVTPEQLLKTHKLFVLD